MDRTRCGDTVQDQVPEVGYDDITEELDVPRPLRRDISRAGDGVQGQGIRGTRVSREFDRAGIGGRNEGECVWTGDRDWRSRRADSTCRIQVECGASCLDRASCRQDFSGSGGAGRADASREATSGQRRSDLHIPVRTVIAIRVGKVNGNIGNCPKFVVRERKDADGVVT